MLRIAEQRWWGGAQPGTCQNVCVKKSPAIINNLSGCVLTPTDVSVKFTRCIVCNVGRNCCTVVNSHGI